MSDYRKKMSEWFDKGYEKQEQGIMSDPIVDLLAYVHSHAKTEHAMSLCGAAWDHYKAIVAKKEKAEAKLATMTITAENWSANTAMYHGMFEAAQAELAEVREEVSKIRSLADDVLRYRTAMTPEGALQEILWRIDKLEDKTLLGMKLPDGLCNHLYTKDSDDKCVRCGEPRKYSDLDF